MSTKGFTRSVIALSISSLLSYAANAEEDNDITQDEIEHVAVWSTAISTSSLYLKGDDIINKQADHISDLLRTIPGVDVGGAHSLNQRITIRSMDDKDLNISIDGAAQNTYMYHHMGNLQIHADILKSVDIEIGSNSVINGGLGGSVRFETKQARELLKPEQTFGGRVQVSSGDNSGNNYSITGYGLLGESFDFIGYYNFVDRSNYDVGGGQILDADGNELADTDGEVKGLEGELDDLLIKFGWNIGNDQRISVGYESYQDEGNYSYRPDMGLATDLAITNSLQVPLLWPTEFTRDTLTLNYDLSFAQSSQLKVSAFSNTSELWRDEMGWADNEAYTSWAAIVTGEAKNTGVNALATTNFDDNLAGDHELTYGLDYIKHDTEYAAQYIASLDTSAEQSTSLALFLQDKIQLNESFAIIPGVRYQDYEIDSTVVDNNFDDITFALAAEYQATDNLLLKASTTQLFKGPEIGEVFVGAGLFDSANQNIEAETGTNTELAFAYQSSANKTNRLALGATVFKTQIDGYIYDYASSPEGGYWKDNIGDIQITGFEAYIGYTADKLTGQITYSSAESDLDAYADYQDLDQARIDREQGDTFTANINYELSQFNLSLNWEAMQVQDMAAGINLDGATLDNAKDGFTVHNVSANWSPESIEGLTVIFGVDNLFDEYYASQSSRTGTSFHPRFGSLYLLDYEPGRNIKATLSYQF
ncbi:TonB-dependent receptor [Paraglaciecola aquimarina]|uniref:TonB-dependent receptor n=1 Tax=Paraglaciecola algarum TaxID=3050085 RepID=A0ABS9D8K3_9ALTE|nr:TonB-dependent receptor [Paraglaciecola sp. G1-23]MCF2947996.1 TonB-dependent receptor [Paraglaciecola sp. G1-23]